MFCIPYVAAVLLLLLLTYFLPLNTKLTFYLFIKKEVEKLIQVQINHDVHEACDLNFTRHWKDKNGGRRKHQICGAMKRL